MNAVKPNSLLTPYNTQRVYSERTVPIFQGMVGQCDTVALSDKGYHIIKPKGLRVIIDEPENKYVGPDGTIFIPIMQMWLPSVAKALGLALNTIFTVMTGFLKACECERDGVSCKRFLVNDGFSTVNCILIKAPSCKGKTNVQSGVPSITIDGDQVMYLDSCQVSGVENDFYLLKFRYAHHGTRKPKTHSNHLSTSYTDKYQEDGFTSTRSHTYRMVEECEKILMSKTQMPKLREPSSRFESSPSLNKRIKDACHYAMVQLIKLMEIFYRNEVRQSWHADFHEEKGYVELRHGEDLQKFYFNERAMSNFTSTVIGLLEDDLLNSRL